MARYKTENGNMTYNVSDKTLSGMTKSDVDKSYPNLTPDAKKQMYAKCKQESKGAK